MFLSTWTKLRNTLGFGTEQGRRRIAKSRGNWGIETERMENRAMLSASGGLLAVAPVAAEVAVAEPRAKFTAPNVAGHWVISGDVAGEATLTQNKNKVTAVITAEGINITVTKGFTNAHRHELTKTVHVTNPTGVGPKRLAVKVHINFADVANPTTFTGEVEIKSLGLSLNVTGNKTVPV